MTDLAAPLPGLAPAPNTRNKARAGRRGQGTLAMLWRKAGWLMRLYIGCSS